MPSYSENDQRAAAQSWRQNGRNLAELSRRDDMPSRSMLWRWKKEGKPHELTGGDDWEEWADRADAREAEAEREREIRRAEREEMGEIETQRDRIEEIIAEGHRQLSEGEVEITASQYKQLVNLKVELGNLSQSKIEWQRAQMTKILLIVMPMLTEQQFAELQLEMEKIDTKSLQKLPTQGVDLDDSAAFEEIPYREPSGEGEQLEEVEPPTEIIGENRPIVPEGADERV
jgi:RNA polymerase-binding transcription factor DksA